MRIRTLVAAVAALAGIVAGTAPAQPALAAGPSSADLRELAQLVGASTPRARTAALPVCTNSSRYDTGTIYVNVPTVGPANSHNPNCVLGMGSTGTGVVVLQLNVNHTEPGCMGAGLVVDGRYGTKTRNVVLWAQAVANFPLDDRDGVYGPKTLMEALYIPVFWTSNNAFYACIRFSDVRES